MLNDSDEVKIARIQRDVELGKQGLESQRLRQAGEQANIERIENDINKFKKSKIAKASIILSIISLILCVLYFSTGSILSGFLGILSLAGFVAAILMGHQVIKAKRNMYIVPMIAGIAFFILGITTINIGKNPSSTKFEKLVWSEIVLNQVIPEPPSDKADITFNSKSNLHITVCDVTPVKYSEYIEQCKQAGFTIEPSEIGSSYSAYNSEGYRLDLTQYSSKKDEMTITLDAPEELGELKWPTSELGKIIPKPKTTVGNVNSDKEDYFFAVVGGLSKEDYDAYVEECYAAGFNVNYDKNDKQYAADNEEGYHLSIDYLGFNNIRIEANSPNYKDSNTESGGFVSEVESSTEEQTRTEELSVAETDPVLESTTSVIPETASPATETNKPESQVPANGIRPEFKAEVDAYEKFMNDYVEFMKKYNSSDNAISMALDYAKMTADYAVWSSKANDWSSDSNISSEELDYYLQAQNRVNTKLLEIN